MTNHTVTETAAAVREAVEQHRTRAAAARTEADTILATARAQAARLVADAETRARQLTADATAAERAAAPLAERATYLGHAEQLRQQISDAEHDVVQLAQEQQQLQETASRLDARLAELGEQRETTAALLAGARERGDVDQVTDLRTRLAGVDEVTGVLQGQHAAARARQLAIGEPTGLGEFAAAANAWQRLTAELRRIENILDPERPEAVHDRLLGDLDAAIAWNLERSAQEKAATATRRSWAPTTVISRR